MSWTRGRTRLMAQAVAMSSIRDEVSDTVDWAVGNDDGMTALLWSAYNGHKDAIELLLDI
eukprot:gene6921-8857_t